jgi:hypothetical protein
MYREGVEGCEKFALTVCAHQLGRVELLRLTKDILSGGNVFSQKNQTFNSKSKDEKKMSKKL